MTDEILFPSLGDWGATRQTLHLYSRAIGVIPRAHAEFHPKWWHLGLKVQPDGLQTGQMARPGGGTFCLTMNLRQHKIVLSTNEGPFKEFDMTQGLTGTQLGEALLSAVAELSLSGNYTRKKFENDDPREYDPEAAVRFLNVLLNAQRVFKTYRATLSGDVGPIQLWPHGFDLSFEWFGTRVERYEEHGKVQEYPSQISLGFYPGDDDNASYFYSNPWPFEAEQLTANPLPEGVRWVTEDWQGTMLPYDELVGDPDAEQRLNEYARAVYNIASPALLV
jgi:Family of unknown function (DUF5996)